MKMVLKILLLLTYLLFFASCASTITSTQDLPDDKAVEYYFRYGQEASDHGKDDIALIYYNKIYELFPTNVNRITRAEYEEAFIYFKQKRYSEAQTLFETIIKRFSDPTYSASFSSNDRWIMLLAQDHLDTIEAIEAEKALVAQKKAEKAERKAQKKAAKAAAAEQALSSETSPDISPPADEAIITETPPAEEPIVTETAPVDEAIITETAPVDEAIITETPPAEETLNNESQDAEDLASVDAEN